MNTISNGDVSDTEIIGESAEDQFAALWGLKDAEEPSEDTKDAPKDKEQDEPAKDEAEANDADEADEDAEETPADEDDEDSDESESTVDVKDEHKFKVTVDGEERDFTLGQLKRLAGQEASLTRKSQEVAATRKALEDKSAAYLVPGITSR